MPFGQQTRYGPSNYVLDGGPDPPSEGTGTINGDFAWDRIQTSAKTDGFSYKGTCTTAMRPVAKLLWTLVYV